MIECSGFQNQSFSGPRLLRRLCFKRRLPLYYSLKPQRRLPVRPAASAESSTLFLLPVSQLNTTWAGSTTFTPAGRKISRRHRSQVGFARQSGRAAVVARPFIDASPQAPHAGCRRECGVSGDFSAWRVKPICRGWVCAQISIRSTVIFYSVP